MLMAADEALEEALEEVFKGKAPPCQSVKGELRREHQRRALSELETGTDVYFVFAFFLIKAVGVT